MENVSGTEFGSTKVRGGEKEQEQNRGWDRYRKILDFYSDSGFKSFLEAGKKGGEPAIVLDIGAGKGRFARECSQKEVNNEKVNVRVVSFERQYAEKGYAETSALTNGEIVPKVAGDWKALPFDDESFDRVISVKAFPLWCEEGEWNLALNEIIRVLKPEGVALMKIPLRASKFRTLIESLKDKVEYNFVGGGVSIKKKVSAP